MKKNGPRGPGSLEGQIANGEGGCLDLTYPEALEYLEERKETAGEIINTLHPRRAEKAIDIFASVSWIVKDLIDGGRLDSNSLGKAKRFLERAERVPNNRWDLDNKAIDRNLRAAVKFLDKLIPYLSQKADEEQKNGGDGEAAEQMRKAG